MLFPSRIPSRPRLRRAVAALAVLGTGLIGVAVVAPTSASASSVTAHDPFGTVHTIKAVSNGVFVGGWAADPDALTKNLTIYAVVDGTDQAKSVTTSTVWRSVIKKYHTGPTPGFQMTVPVPSGKHTVCIAAQHLGAGMDSILKCFATPVGRTLSSSALAAHDPVGDITSSSARSGSLTVSGWATDPDLVARRSRVVLYVDGYSAATVATSHLSGTLPSGAGRESAFDITVPVSKGTHMACLWAVNIGFGANDPLGCRAVDTRHGSPISSSAPSTSILPKVAKEAKKHIGQRYVWGAAGPKTFDCSGLVLYSYKKQGFTPPRVAADQFAAARMIPASHAQPGDLVFYHDSEGHVYHVGIYTHPGMTVAAIDEAEGVNHQPIWDPSSASYGSFTHT